MSAIHTPIRRAVVLGACGLALAVAGCGGGGDDDVLQGVVRTPPLSAGALTLPEVSRPDAPADAPLRAPRGQLRLVYFGYTHCPDVCPTTLSDVRQALETLPAGQRRQVQVAMVTVDPARDTPRVLSRYLGHFATRFAAFRTTDQARLRRVERAFGAAHRKGPVRAGGAYDMEHTAWLYAVDDRGVVRVQWAFGTTGDAIAHDLRRLLQDLPTTSPERTT